MRRRVVWLLIGMVAVADLVIGALAALNRGGTPECVLTLSERELSLPQYRDDDSSGLALVLLTTELPPPAERRIAWRRGAELGRVPLPWLDGEKLAALGFRTAWGAGDAAARERYSARAARPAFVVLEHEGEGFRRWLAGRETELAQARAALAGGTVDTARIADLEAQLELDRTGRSRLFPVDAGRDPVDLRSRYPDRTSYCIVPGLVRLGVEGPAEPEPHVRGRVELLLGEIDVPPRLRARLAALLPGETAEQVFERERRQEKPPWPRPVPARYVVKVAFGHRYEPWIVDVSPIAAPAHADR